MMKTGGTIFQCGFATPEVVVVNETQMLRAIADPFGYTTRPAAAQAQSWSKTKLLYR
jgi:hypothetical protein